MERVSDELGNLFGGRFGGKPLGELFYGVAGSAFFTVAAGGASGLAVDFPAVFQPAMAVFPVPSQSNSKKCHTVVRVIKFQVNLSLERPQRNPNIATIG